MSGQHVLRILNFRSLLEHCLVERFSAATLAQRDFYNDIQLWANLDAALAYWKQWLEDVSIQIRKKSAFFILLNYNMYACFRINSHVHISYISNKLLVSD